MSIYKHTKHYLAVSLLLLGSVLLTACSDDEISHGNLTGDTTNGLNLTLSVKPLTSKVMTKATSTRTDRSRIEQLDIVLADKDDNITKIIHINPTAQASYEADYTGLVGNKSLPIDDPSDLNLHIGSSDLVGVTNVYLVANYINEAGTLMALPDVPTVADLQNLRQYSYLGMSPICTMFGNVTVKGEQHANHNNNNNNNAETVTLTRTIAMITLEIDGSNLYDGVVIVPKRVELKNVPRSCSIAGENNITETQDIIERGIFYDLGSSWGKSLAKSGFEQKFPIPNNTHGVANEFPLYMFENLQGEGSNIANDDTNVNEKDKKPISGKEPLCSYIEVTAEYYYTNPGTVTTRAIPNQFSGIITYRFYLGGDVENDFDIKRNTHYQLTLKLNNWGGLVEKGVIDEDNDNYNGEADENDVVWRVDYGEMSVVIDNELEVPAGGSRVDIRLDKASVDALYPTENENIQINYNLTGNANNYIWLKANSGPDPWKPDPSNAKLKEYIHDEGGDYYILKIYLKPIDHISFQNIEDGTGTITNPSRQPLNTVEKWLESGYREAIFSIAKSGSKDPFDEFTIRQWLPLPVMDPADLAGTSDPEDPRNAKLYYSRFDIYHGELLPWATGDFVGKDLYPGQGFLCTNPDHLRIDNPESQDVYRDFTPEYGFHNTVAYFVTARENNISLDFNDGIPSSVMEYAFFEAANAELPTDNSMFHETAEDVNSLSHYGLASVSEWKKIEEHGLKDPRYPLYPGREYWTSSIPKTPTMNTVYEVGTGTTYEVDRTAPYRGRMVYHRDDEATPLKPAAPAHPNN